MNGYFCLFLATRTGQLHQQVSGVTRCGPNSQSLQQQNIFRPEIVSLSVPKAPTLVRGNQPAGVIPKSSHQTGTQKGTVCISTGS